MTAPADLVPAHVIATEWGVARTTVGRMVKRGELRGYRLGTALRISRADAADFLNRQVVTGERRSA